MEEKLLGLASKVTKPVSLAAAIVIVAYLLFRAILGLPVFSSLGESGSLALLSQITQGLFYLALVALVLGVGSYAFLRYRKEGAARPQASPAPFTWAITGNVFLSSGRPARGATVFVEGVDRQKETDASGWFSIDVHEQKSWTVHALYKDELAERVVRRGSIGKPVRLQLEPAPGSPSAPQSLPAEPSDPAKDAGNPQVDAVLFLGQITRHLGVTMPSVADGTFDEDSPKIELSKVEYLITLSGRTYEFSLKPLNTYSEAMS